MISAAGYRFWFPPSTSSLAGIRDVHDSSKVVTPTSLALMLVSSSVYRWRSIQLGSVAIALLSAFFFFKRPDMPYAWMIVIQYGTIGIVTLHLAYSTRVRGWRAIPPILLSSIALSAVLWPNLPSNISGLWRLLPSNISGLWRLLPFFAVRASRPLVTLGELPMASRVVESPMASLIVKSPMASLTVESSMASLIVESPISLIVGSPMAPLEVESPTVSLVVESPMASLDSLEVESPTILVTGSSATSTITQPSNTVQPSTIVQPSHSTTSFSDYMVSGSFILMFGAAIYALSRWNTRPFDERQFRLSELVRDVDDPAPGSHGGPHDESDLAQRSSHDPDVVGPVLATAHISERPADPQDAADDEPTRLVPEHTQDGKVDAPDTNKGKVVEGIDVVHE
ncbi:hypothetical protein ONZ45_g17574 [Pleurotus djamor]|nr:hypothetical protein ONZ45_g17574 [Pleurotus djamor]